MIVPCSLGLAGRSFQSLPWQPHSHWELDGPLLNFKTWTKARGLWSQSWNVHLCGTKLLPHFHSLLLPEKSQSLLSKSTTWPSFYASLHQNGGYLAVAWLWNGLAFECGPLPHYQNWHSPYHKLLEPQSTGTFWGGTLPGWADQPVEVTSFRPPPPLSERSRAPGSLSPDRNKGLYNFHYLLKTSQATNWWGKL